MALTQDIAIVGGGIGGLAAATALAQRGAQVTVFEQAEALREVGAGLQVSPNGMRVLEGLGVADALKARSVIAQAVSLRRAESDREVARLRLGDVSSVAAYAFVHRADLIDVLATAAQEAAVQVRLSRQVQAIEPGNTPLIRFDDGDTDTADLIIDASGLHSGLRAVLNPETKAFFTGQVAWRAIIPNRAGRGPQVQVHMAPGAHLVSYPLREGALLNLVAVQERTAWAAEGWAHRDDPANLRAAFQSAAPAVQDMLAEVRDVHLWGLFRHPVARNWTGQGAALLGDAAHPTLPFLAQGAVMALEDAWALAACLDAAPDMQAGLAAYQQMRHARVTRVIKTANGNAERYHLRYGPVRFAAHVGLKTVSTVAPFAMTAPFRWLYDYDVTRDAP